LRRRWDWRGALAFAVIVALIAFIAWGILITVRPADGAQKEVDVVKLVKGDADLLTRLVWAEARSESFEGQCAVVWVVLNRLAREPGRFPSTIAGIIKAPYAFSCFNTSDPQCAKVKAIDERAPAFVEAMHAVTAVLTGRVKDNTMGSDHYFVSKMANPPSWRKAMTLRAIIGAHTFMSEKP
jgi:N-acetylmuramoyl-L-alanine amidase